MMAKLNWSKLMLTINQNILDFNKLKAVVLLPTVGLINEYHEPPLFLSVERPLYNKYIIPI